MRRARQRGAQGGAREQGSCWELTSTGRSKNVAMKYEFCWGVGGGEATKAEAAPK